MESPPSGALLLACLLGPGLLLRGLLRARVRALEVPLLAAAFWVVAFWWLWLLGTDWRWPVLALGFGALVAGLYLHRGVRSLDRSSAAVLLLSALLCAALAASTLAAPGVDGAMHTAVARVLGEAHGHPRSYRPLWPIDAFHSYPVGQPTLTALFSEVGGLPWLQAGLWGHALCQALALLAFAAAMGRWVNGRALGFAVGTLAVLCARAPLYFWTWGGGPNVLGLAFCLLAVAAGADLLRQPAPRWEDAVVCGLAAAASLLTHGVSAVAFTWAAPLLVLAVCVRHKERLQGAAWLVAAGALAALLCAPFLAGLRPVLGAGELAWGLASIRQSVQGHAWGALRLLPVMLHDLPVIAGGVCAALLLWLRPQRASFPFALAALLLLLMSNAAGAWLPLSVLLYPDRIAVLVLYPLSLFALEAVDAAAARWTPPRVFWAALVAGLLLHAVVLQKKMFAAGVEKTLVTVADLRLLATLDAQVPPGCWVQTNYGDAGQWIPALLGRPITFPQVNVLWMEEARADVHPCAAVRGAKRPYGGDSLPNCPPGGGPGCRSLAHESGAEVFAIDDPGLLVEVRGLR